MVRTKYKFLLYKKYNVDIWGYLRNNLWNNKKKKYLYYNYYNINKKLKFKLESNFPRNSHFVKKIVYFFFNKFSQRIEYRLKQMVKMSYLLKHYEKKWQKVRQYKNLQTLRLILLFYVNIKHRQFQRIAVKAKKKHGFFEANYLLLLEGRLVCIVYRSGLILNMFDAIAFVKKRCIKVNGIIIPYLNYVVPIMKIIGFRTICKGGLFITYWKRLIRKLVLYNMPNYIYFFYTFFFFFLKRKPQTKDYMHPFHLDMYRAIGYGGYAK